MCSWTLTASVLGMYNAKVVIVGPSGVGKVYFIAGRVIVCTETRPQTSIRSMVCPLSGSALLRAKRNFSTPLEGSQADIGPR